MDDPPLPFVLNLDDFSGKLRVELAANYLCKSRVEIG